jgi:ribosomal small subunit protein bTHX
MGKGDKKSAKGKRVMGSFGNTRPKESNKPKATTATK